MIELYLCLSLLLLITNYSKLTHPIMLGCSILLMTVAISSVLCMKYSMFVFILFMGFVGGVLVIYAYAVAVVPYNQDNEESEGYTFNLYTPTSQTKWKMFVCFSTLSLTPLIYLPMKQTSEMHLQYMKESYFASESSGIMIIYLGSVLFMTMLVSVQMSSQMSGALVQK